MRPINAATPEQVAAFRASIGATTKKARARKASKPLVQGCLIQRPDGWEIQIPVYTSRAQVQGRGSRYGNYSDGDTVVQTVGLALAPLRQIDRARIVQATITRISPNGSNDNNNMDDDNLPPTMKHARDPAARWIVEGADIIGADGKVKTEGIGNFDRQLKKERGFTWLYAQLTHELDRRLYGIRIRFRLRPR